MVSLVSLWAPIVVSALFVFVASWIIHMVLKYHRSDFGKVPNEDEVRRALREASIPPGEYVIPHAETAADMALPEFLQKLEEGPVGFLTIRPNRRPSMAKNLVQWFIYSIVVSIFSAYVAGRALMPGAEYLSVFRFAGCAAFLGYAVALWQQPIWYGRSWGTTLKSTFDGLIYALLTAGVFGWLWPA